MKLSTSLRGRLESGESSLGPFSKFTDPAAIEAMALAGFDHAVIDMEHGPVGVDRAQDLVRAARVHGMAPMIRVPRNDSSEILRALDIGAEGVHVPHVSSAADAERAVLASFFHPVGERGVCRYVRAAEYSHRGCADHFEAANRDVLLVLHVEGQEGLADLPKILAIEGAGVIFLGPYDLSQSCGHPGEVRHPEVVKVMRYAAHLAQSSGAVVGTFVDNAEDAAFWHAAGVRYLCCSVDVGIFLQGCRRMKDECLEAMREGDAAAETGQPRSWQSRI
jgi:4-hydroxy-2-oxoheptanedioate aldolase